MEQKEVLAGLLQELRRGTIVLAVLSQLDKPMYGYNLITVLSRSGIPVEANTLYPLLRRLEGQGVLQSNWETDSNKPRKYYSTTPMGQEVCKILRRYWEETVRGINLLWKDESDDA